ncbi:MAG: hypothetical protein IPQ25_17040 [Chitinophagaceae bacterium]|nr:hypothetical protein [Chitinophagaceae bacterium]
MPRPAKKTTHSDVEVPINSLVVRALRPGFRRAGRAWPAEATTVALADLSTEEIAALLAEPLLETELVAV